ncbi:MAG TPA: HlyD family efflux transporter periplasmic adaptor subunit [Gammaproteobacteria bacterium]
MHNRDIAMPPLDRRRRQRIFIRVIVLLAGAGLVQSLPQAHDAVAHVTSQADAQRHDANAAGAPLAEAAIPSAQQQEQGLRYTVVPETDTAKRLALPGRIIADPDASALVVAPEAGRVMAPEQGFPALGGSVAKGTSLAVLQPVLTSTELADLKAELADAERDLKVTRLQLDQYRLAGQDVNALNLQSASAYSTLRIEHAAAGKRVDEFSKVLHRRVPLTAPLTGHVSYARVEPGRVVSPGDVLFEIIRPERLWVSALSYDLDFVPAEQAYATTAGGARLKLELVGAAPSLSGQALPVYYRIVDPPAGLPVGQVVSVHADGAARDQTFTLPAASVLDDGNGGHYVWVQRAAEDFLAQPVRARGVDNDRYVIESGLAAGARVVTAGLDLFARPQ